MIYPLFHGSWSFLVSAGLWLANVVLVRALVPRAFGSRRFFVLATSSIMLLLFAHGAWALFHNRSVLGLMGMTIGSAAPVFLALTLLSVPVSALVVGLGRRVLGSRDLTASAEEEPAVTEALAGAPISADAPENVAPKPRRVSRRNVLALAASAAPAAAVGVGVRGFKNGFAGVELARRTLTVPHLPLAFEGMKIAQLSDVHLGVYRQLPDLERALEILSRDKVDLLVLTGDFVEHGDLLEDALRLVRQVPTTHGAYACLGNHEYFQKVAAVRATYDRVGVPLLVNASETLHVGRERVALLGVDDPRRMSGDIKGALRGFIERSLVNAHGDATFLLSHRPEAVVPASGLGVALVLSGHTHGGQIGYNGKSAFEPMLDDGYLWGAYQREQTSLYTTSGFGHWYPFRLGCASELPLLTLTGGLRGLTIEPHEPT